jgi:hypothetical protein
MYYKDKGKESTNAIKASKLVSILPEKERLEDNFNIFLNKSGTKGIWVVLHSDTSNPYVYENYA